MSHSAKDEKRISEIIEMRRKGATLQGIAEHYLISKERVRQILKREGIWGLSPADCFEHTCQLCHHKWHSRIITPQNCPRCCTFYWNGNNNRKQKKRRTGIRHPFALGVTVDAKMMQEINSICALTGETKAALIRRAIMVVIEKKEQHGQD